MQPDILFSEARARIIWGEPSSSVRDFLTSSGISAIDADAKIEMLCAERNAELRKMGVTNVLIGAMLIPGAGITLYLCLRTGAASGSIRCATVCLLGCIYGIWKFCKGIVYLARPQSEHKSMPNIIESDILD
jgi:hypothetical protein